MISSQTNSFFQDIQCSTSDLPTDSVSSFSWLPFQLQPTFACASWDSTVRIFSLSQEVNSLKLERKFELPNPLLSLDSVPNAIIGGCVDGTIRIFDLLKEGKTQVFGETSEHEDAVKSVYWIGEYQICVSLSYDKTMKFWDFRQKSSTQTIKLEQKPYCADKIATVISVGFNDGRVGIADLNNIVGKPELFKWDFVPQLFHDVEKITDISMFRNDGRFGFGASSDWGRGAIYNITRDVNNTFTGNKVMTFKAHKHYVNTRIDGERISDIMYPINAIGMHQTTQTLFTAGGEGNIYFWDYGQKNKTGTLDFNGNSVTKAKFNPDCSLLVYANGYDYARGIQGISSQKIRIGVHKV